MSVVVKFASAPGLLPNRPPDSLGMSNYHSQLISEFTDSRNAAETGDESGLTDVFCL